MAGMATTLLVGFTQAGSVHAQLTISTDSSANFQGELVTDDQALRLDGSFPASVQQLGLPEAADINALHIIDDTTLLFSVKSSLSLNSGYASPGDILQWDSGTITIFASHDDLGLGAGTSIDAVSMRGEDVIFSLNISDEVNGLTVTDSDLLQWNSIDGTTFYIVETSCGIASDADLSAVHVLESEQVLLAFSTGTSIGNSSYKTGDIIRCDPVNSQITLHQRFSNEGPEWQAITIDAISTYRGKMIFKNSFESPQG